jgi:protein-disulfide isomerase
MSLSLNVIARSVLSVILLGINILPAIAESKTKVDAALEQQVLEILRKNPDVVYQVIKKYAEEKQAAEIAKEQIAQANVVRKYFKDNIKTIVGDSPTLGATDRKYLLVVFSDFQCPFCAKFNDNAKKLVAKHPEVTVVFKNFPLTQAHPQALPAAQAAWAAHKQGKFWAYHDVLFANQQRLGEALYLETAKQLKLDLKKFQADYGAAEQAIVQDYTLGRKLNVQSTPALFLNGESLVGANSVEELEKYLARAKRQ